MRGEAEPRSTIMMPNSIMINDFSCDRIYFPRAIVVNRNPPIPLETSALDKLKINTRKNNNRKNDTVALDLRRGREDERAGLDVVIIRRAEGSVVQ